MVLDQTKKTLYSVKSAEKALIFLKAINEEAGEISIACLTKKLGWNKNLVFRLMATFEKLGYVEKDKSTGNYFLGLTAYELGNKFLSRMDLLRIAKPIMQSLAFECEETVYLGVHFGSEVVLFDKVDTTNPVNVMSLIGKRYPVTWNAVGEIESAFGEKHEAYPSTNAPIFSKKTHDNPRQLGFSIEFGGLGVDVASLAVPFFNGQKKVLGCLCFVGPQERFTVEKVKCQLHPRLKVAGQSLSYKLGCLGHHMPQ